MNSDKHNPSGVRGNAMIYIILALALLGGLTMVISRGNDTGGDDLGKETNELLTTRAVAFAGSASFSAIQRAPSGV